VKAFPPSLLVPESASTATQSVVVGHDTETRSRPGSILEADHVMVVPGGLELDGLEVGEPEVGLEVPDPGEVEPAGSPLPELQPAMTEPHRARAIAADAHFGTRDSCLAVVVMILVPIC
jgi:hypothetical protein